MARKSLKDVQGVVAKQLAAISTAEQRELLRTPVHFIPLNIQALEITLGNIIKEDRQDQDIQGQAALENFRDEILKFVAKQTNTYKNKIKITSTGTEFAGSTGVRLQLFMKTKKS
jgi:septum formation topological specificity factor MinE